MEAEEEEEDEREKERRVRAVARERPRKETGRDGTFILVDVREEIEEWRRVSVEKNTKEREGGRRREKEGWKDGRMEVEKESGEGGEGGRTKKAERRETKS